MAKSSLLIVDDDPGLQKQLRWCFEDYDVTVAGDRESALAAMTEEPAAVVTLDLGLPPDPANASEGLRALDEILELAPRTKVVVVTGNDDREVAVRAVAQGAYDFYEKPVDPDVLRLIVERAFRLRALEDENRRLMREAATPLSGVIGNSDVMQEVCRRIEKIGPTNVTVLLLGESGTGKEVLARALHSLSDRKDRDFIAINCAAIPETLLESELFGYEKGAFTGATKQTRGKLEFADGGTLFLDEIGDLPSPLQAKLLRFLQERVLERVGGREEIAVDTRVICATHKDLRGLIKEHAFREDLFYRVSEVALTIPPLRDRTGDVVLIARALLAAFSDLHRGKIKDFSKAAIRAMETYGWPGNVRELENRVKRAVIMADGKFVEPVDLELEESADNEIMTLKAYREQAEETALKLALAVSDGQVGRAAEILDVSRPTVYHLLRKYNMQS
ncbi:MAG: PEP-CTERM-box response regulator transcription factor [Gammaproteobacteria bacterium]